ncbi:aminotransferase class IV [Pelagicoccus albus]|uniref:branched-chain-amino-acid transaminase n=1 Tax=Pelagicoccus albus TaxID=415222 RepID=A0A7X1E972_9BACT|nr:aminotransferase class IV [Pelagicoccus albus]MBC2606903.1 aminotransferase class IV [Pelagicoccus albus]
MSSIFIGDRFVQEGYVESDVLSRGFAFGFGVFETIKFIHRRPCFFSEHIERLKLAASSAGLAVELEEVELWERAIQLFNTAKLDSGVFKIVILDRGEDRIEPVVFVRSAGLPDMGPPLKLLASSVVKASQAFTSRHKSTNYMESILEAGKAKANGFDDCVFANEYGFLTECSVANLFFVQGKTLCTPELACGLLDGIVRSKILSIAPSFGLEVVEGRFSWDDLLSADEVFITSSGVGPRPVESFVGPGQRKAIYEISFLKELRAAYLKLEEEEVNGAI